MTTFETPMVLLVIVGVMTAALAFLNTEERRDRSDLSVIAAIARETAFDLSCSPDGRLDDRRSANCFERKGYRFMREGTAIARVGTDGRTELVYRADMMERFGSPRALREARLALEDSLGEKHPVR